MKLIKSIWKNISSRVWLIVTTSVLILTLTISLVLTQVDLIRGTFDILFGGDRANVTGTTNLYKSDYNSKTEVLAAANNFNIKTVEEGITLLKNDDNALPLKKSAKISVFGKNSINLVYGGSGSGGGKNVDCSTLYDSLSDAQFIVNPTLQDFYSDSAKSGKGRAKNPEMGDIISGFGTGETPIAMYTSDVKSSYAQYKDAALVVISRIGGEGFDLPRTMKTSYDSDSKIDGARNASDHYLQLDKNETDMIAEACNNFDNVIIILNTSQTIELGFLDDINHYAFSDKIKAALWLGLPGATGVMALGKVLNGSVNPSGRSTDTYARDFTKDPTWYNFGNNNSNRGNNYTQNNKGTNYYFVNYEEGIYVGYRYYETRGFTDGESWYKSNVVYPFGYGLSYTTFDWQIVNKNELNLSSLTKDSNIDVKVKVTNTGAKAGKDVVQLYVTAPYVNGEIEKSYVTLAAFEKTPMLYPASEADENKPNSCELTLSFSAYDIASYDYNDANKNSFSGYELDSGDYAIKISKNSHTVVDSFSIKATQNIKFSNDTTTGKQVKNRFDDADEKLDSVLSRANWTGTRPSVPTAQDREVTQEFIDSLKYVANDEGKPWKTDEMPTQSSAVIAKKKIKVKFAELIGKDYNDPLWDKLLDQLTIEQMARLIGTGAFGTLQIDNIDKPKTVEADGPSGFTNFMSDGGPIHETCFYATECVMGATWNKQLAYEMGQMIGSEGLVGNDRGDGLPYSGWYAPAINIHRSPFSGRNWEYYSEDGVMSGHMAANVCLGAKSKGVYTFVKHFAVNDQETNRDSDGILVWAEEQTLREIYLKPFELAVKKGQAAAMMSSFNRIGKVWAGGNYQLLTEVLRNEWGFKGMVITDYNLLRYMNPDQMIRAGGDLVLNQGNKSPTVAKADATQVSLIRQSTKNIFYTIVNSNAMNNIIDGYFLPIWVIVMLVIDSAIVLGLGVWSFFVIKKTLKKQKAVVKESTTGGDNEL